MSETHDTAPRSVHPRTQRGEGPGLSTEQPACPCGKPPASASAVTSPSTGAKVAHHAKTSQGGHDRGEHDHGAHDRGEHDHGAHDQGEHDHGAHDHDFRSASRRALTVALLLLSGIFIAELVGGLLSGSLALLADAAHLLTDVAAIILALIAQWFARRPSNATRSFGFMRVEILAALANGVTLWGISGYIVYEAVTRLQHPPAVASAPMIIIATAGLLVQTVAALVLARASGESLNVKGAYVHAATDAVQSAAVVLVGIAMWLTGWWLLDPIVSLLIAVLIAYSGGKIVWEASHVLLEGTPPEVDLRSVARTLTATKGVRAVADLHAWSLTTGYNALSAHIIALPELTAEQRESLRERVAGNLTDAFPLHHVTLQVERRCGLAEEQNCCGWLSSGPADREQEKAATEEAGR